MSASSKRENAYVWTMGSLRDAGGRGRNVSPNTLNMVTMDVKRVPRARTAGRNQSLHSFTLKYTSYCLQKQTACPNGSFV